MVSVCIHAQSPCFPKSSSFIFSKNKTTKTSTSKLFKSNCTLCDKKDREAINNQFGLGRLPVQYCLLVTSLDGPGTGLKAVTAL